MKNKMADLRNHLFAALEGLADNEKPLDLDRARTISAVAQTIINSAKAEAEFCELTGTTPTSDFIEGTPLAKRPRLVGNG